MVYAIQYDVLKKLKFFVLNTFYACIIILKKLEGLHEVVKVGMVRWKAIACKWIIYIVLNTIVIQGTRVKNCLRWLGHMDTKPD